MKTTTIGSIPKAAIALVSVVLVLNSRSVAPAQSCWLNLPAYPGNSISLQLSSYYPTLSSAYSLLTAKVGSGPIPAAPPAALYPVWCMDEQTVLNTGQGGDPVPFTSFTGYLFSSCDPNLDSELGQGNAGVGLPADVYVSPTVWQKVNYMINHRAFTNAPYSGPVAGYNFAFYWDVQQAIWSYVGGPLSEDYPEYGLVSHGAVIQALTNAANAHAANWQPACGDKIAAIADLDPTYLFDPLDDVQLVFLEVPLCPVVIGDTVWLDTNANGLQDSGEPGIPGVTLTLTGTTVTGGSITDHTFTDANGHYLFTEQAGTYTVTVDASNFAFGRSAGRIDGDADPARGEPGH